MKARYRNSIPHPKTVAIASLLEGLPKIRSGICRRMPQSGWNSFTLPPCVMKASLVWTWVSKTTRKKSRSAIPTVKKKKADWREVPEVAPLAPGLAGAVIACVLSFQNLMREWPAIRTGTATDSMDRSPNDLRLLPPAGGINAERHELLADLSNRHAYLVRRLLAVKIAIQDVAHLWLVGDIPNLSIKVSLGAAMHGWHTRLIGFSPGHPTTPSPDQVPEQVHKLGELLRSFCYAVERGQQARQKDAGKANPTENHNGQKTNNLNQVCSGHLCLRSFRSLSPSVRLGPPHGSSHRQASTRPQWFRLAVPCWNGMTAPGADGCAL